LTDTVLRITASPLCSVTSSQKKTLRFTVLTRTACMGWNRTVQW